MKYIFFLFFSLSIYAQDTLVHSKQSVIALDNMNVVYRGVPNPISIAVNDAKSYKITGNGVKQNEDGSYTLSPGSGLTTKVYVEITKHDDTVLVEEHEFRIKSLSSPIATINDQYSTNSFLVFNKENLKDAIIRLTIAEFPWEIKLMEIISFKVIYKNKAVFVEGSKINREALELIMKAKRNSLIIIDDIKFKESPNVEYRKIKPIFIKLD